MCTWGEQLSSSVAALDSMTAAVVAVVVKAAVNIAPEGSASIQAFPLGIVLDFAAGLVVSNETKARPNLTSFLARFIAQYFPDFAYTTIQLNRNCAARLHVDSNNYGPSCIIAVGDYTGGHLWVYDEEDGDCEIVLDQPLKGWRHLKVGCVLKGRCVSIKDRWHRFNGNFPHMVLPFEGHRTSLVYFASKDWPKMPLAETRRLAELGFTVPAAPASESAPADPTSESQLKDVAALLAEARLRAARAEGRAERLQDCMAFALSACKVEPEFDTARIFSRGQSKVVDLTCDDEVVDVIDVSSDDEEAMIFG
ncbi:unnamed protein product [Polarella glacialis]|uniref:Uncharacterized protein n=1 Tax=Polarella glacialis TaxID=89957 RepID=A0A813FHE7_POLGL|nr:unnamed protein product [Polarella glacialis]